MTALESNIKDAVEAVEMQRAMVGELNEPESAAPQPRVVALPEIDSQKCLDTLSKLVQIKSYSKTTGELEATQFMADRMRALGLDANVYPFDHGTRQNAIGIWQGTDPSHSKRLLFNGHVDTNPVSEGWTIDPWEGKVDENFIYGIGVSNMKAGCAAYFCAVEALKLSGWTPRGDVVLTYVVGELQGGVGTMAAIEQGRMNADYFVNREPSDVKAVTMHAEDMEFEIELVGDTRHMSAREEAVDVVLAAAELVPRLTGMTPFSGAKSKSHEKVNRLHVGVVHAALGKELAEWRPPQVADYCKILGSARYAPGQTVEGVLTDMRKVIEKVAGKFPGLNYTPKKRDIPTMPAFEVDPDSRIVKALNAAYHDVRGEEQPTGLLKPTCFYGSDAGHLFKRLGMEGVVCGPGGKYNTRPDEKVDIPDYLDCIRTFIRLVVDICG